MRCCWAINTSLLGWHLLFVYQDLCCLSIKTSLVVGLDEDVFLLASLRLSACLARLEGYQQLQSPTLSSPILSSPTRHQPILTYLSSRMLTEYWRRNSRGPERKRRESARARERGGYAEQTLWKGNGCGGHAEQALGKGNGCTRYP
jgi:hypothetical protein